MQVTKAGRLDFADTDMDTDMDTDTPMDKYTDMDMQTVFRVGATESPAPKKW
jgi:hypothetical protein